MIIYIGLTSVNLVVNGIDVFRYVIFGFLFVMIIVAQVFIKEISELLNVRLEFVEIVFHFRVLSIQIIHVLVDGGYFQ
jgi:hypothetical protein